MTTSSRKEVLKNKFIREALIQTKCATLTKRQLAENTAAERERHTRRCQPQRQLQKGGVIYAAQAREMVKQRNEEGGTQLERALDREWRLRLDLEESEERRQKDHDEWTTLFATYHEHS